MLEVRTWWRGELQHVRCFARGEVRVGLLGADLYVPIDGPPVSLLEHRGGWIATEPPGWRLCGGAPRPGGPLRWCEVGDDLVTWTCGAWTVDARRVRLPPAVGRPPERPWIPLVASATSLLLIAWVALQPLPMAEMEWIELRGTSCGFRIVPPLEVASARSTLSPQAGEGRGGRLLARQPLAVPEHVAPASPLRVRADAPGTLGSLLEGGPGAGVRGDGIDTGHPGVGAHRAEDAVFSDGWVSTVDDTRIAVVPRAGVGFAPVLDALRDGRLPPVDLVRPEALALHFTPESRERLQAEITPHRSLDDTWIVRVAAQLDVAPERVGPIGVHLGPDQRQDADVLAWLDRRVAELPDPGQVQIFTERAPAGVAAIWWLGDDPVHWSTQGIPTTVVHDAPTAQVPDGARWRGFTEAPLRVRTTADLVGLELELDPARVRRWRVLGHEGAHLADVDGPGGDARAQWASSGRAVLVAELVLVDGPGDLGVARLLRRSGTVAAEAPIVGAGGTSVRHAWAAAQLGLALLGTPVADWRTLHHAAIGAPELQEALRLARPLLEAG